MDHALVATRARPASSPLARWLLLGLITIVLVPFLQAPGRADAVDEACPYGYAVEHTIYFGVGAASGVPNYELGGGCTIMDQIVDGAPFASHGRFVTTAVARSTTHLLRGVVSLSEYFAVVRAATASDIGRSHPVTDDRDAPVDRIGAVLFTVRDTMPTDPAGTLGGLADCDVLVAEPSGSVGDFYGMDAAEIAPFFDDAGIEVPSIGVSLDDLRTDVDGVIEDAEALGASYARFSGPSEWTLDDYVDAAAELNDIGAQLQEHGITLAYHNHGWEFDELGDGVRGYDVLVRQTDPGLVTMELDIYWAESAGASVVDLVTRYPGRFQLLHLKDMAVDDGEPSFADVGGGVIDFAEIFAHGDMAGLRYSFIEHDQPEPDGVTSACNSMAYLSQLTY